MDNYALLFLVLPMLSFVLQISFGKRIGRNAHYISLVLIGMMLAQSIYIFFSSIHHTEPFVDSVVSWFTTSGMFSFEVGLKIDQIASIMLLIVSLISFLVHLYSTEYMKDDPRYTRYFAYLGLFTFSMNGIVLAPSLIMMYVFWELVGLSSYLLIGFWFEKDTASEACKKAFLVNRVGDIGMFIGIMIIYFQVHTLTFEGIASGVSSGAFSGSEELLTLAGVLVFLGAVGKSAQFPLHIWLPDAMEGPTPVSALIHAATMVAAGVYMCLRIFPFLTLGALEVIAYIGAATAIFAAIVAITQNDIKRVLAYSTVSQLGYMILAIGVGAFNAAFFHLATHAMFKACLFLCSGSVIHGMHHALHHLDDHHTDPQDMRNMGGLKSKMPITYVAMLISTLAISGVPLFSGFLSKDAILAGALSFYHHHHGWSILIPLAGFGSAMITAFYMFRLIFLTFHGEPKEQKIYDKVHESGYAMTVPLVILSVLSFAFVFTFNVNPFNAHGWFEHMVGHGSNVTGISIKELKAGFHHAHDSAMILSILCASVGIALSIAFYLFRVVDPNKFASALNRLGLYSLSYNKFFIDEIYNVVIYRPFMWWSNIFSKIDWNLYDQRFIDGFGWATLKLSDKAADADYSWLDQKIVDGAGKITNYFGKELKPMQSGIIQNYIMAGMVAIILIIFLAQQL